MSTAQLDSDSSDSDIFVIKQIKPVNKLTLQEALIIKHGVLNSLQAKNDTKKKRKSTGKCNLDASGKKLKKGALSKKTFNNKKNTNEKGNTPKKGVQPTFSESPKAPVDVFKIFKSRTPEKKTDAEKCDNEHIRLSPGVSRKRKNFNIPNSPKTAKLNKHQTKTCKTNGKKNLSKLFQSEDCTGFDEIKAEVKEEKIDLNSEEPSDPEKLKINDYITVLNSYKAVDEKQCLNNSQLLSFILKKIIHDEIEKQIELQISSSKEGSKVEKLLSEKDCEVLEKFFNLDENLCKVYVRMLCRRKDWHRVSSINYADISNNLQIEFDVLNREGFVDVNIEDEDIKTQMDLLSKNEVQQLCKAFNAPIKAGGTYKKNELINSLIVDSKSQKSVADMLRKNNTMTRVNLLKREIKNYLGMCVKLNDIALSAFKKILLLFSFPHYYEEEDKRFSNQLFLCLKVFKHGLKFPQYKLSPTVVFETCDDFEMYQEALLLRDSFEIAINNKEQEEFQSIGMAVKAKLQKLLNDDQYQKRFLNLKPYLQKFSAGTVFSKILTRYCKTLKKKTDPGEIISICRLLLDQNLFMTDKRGEWYEILTKALERLKDNNAAAEVLIQSQKDPFVNEVQKLALQLRGQALLKKKAYGVSESSLREVLDDLCTTSVQEPPSIEIKGKPLQGNKSGYKSIYIEENENGKTYTSVEERAISYYKSIGFTNGYHVEGGIIQTIYFLLFYDIIYNLSPSGVFQSAYQEFPLDFNSRYFYLSRKEDIDTRLQLISNSDISELELILKEVYNANYETSCGIIWSESFSPKLFCDIIQCITPPILAFICRRFVENFRVARSGFPDLTLWNCETRKCKFVEVKSPNDKLSPAQRVWMDYLRSVGADCEVCNVKNTSVRVLP